MSYNATRLRILELVNTQVLYDKGYLRVNNDIILNTGSDAKIKGLSGLLGGNDTASKDKFNKEQEKINDGGVI